MQRLYSMFPDRGPGLGLALLRLALAAMLLLDPRGRLLDGHAPWPLHLAWMAAVLLASGWLSPIGSLLAAAVTLPRIHEPIVWALLMLIVAQLLLGPGAYSLDARLFGRRVFHRHGQHDDDGDGAV